MIIWSSGVFRNNLFCDNQAGDTGGGLYSFGCLFDIKNNVFRRNKAIEIFDSTDTRHLDSRGGALYSGCPLGSIDGNIFLANESNLSTIYLFDACFTENQVKFENNLVAYNTDSINTLLINDFDDGAIVANNTFFMNETVYDSACIRAIDRQASLCCFNNIFYNNDMHYDIELWASTSRWVTDTCVKYASIHCNLLDTSRILLCSLAVAEIGLDNFYESPQFIPFDDYNFRLRNTSPCIDRGLYSCFYHIHTGETKTAYAPETDLDGMERPYGAGYDIGAYEYNPDAIEEFVQNDYKPKLLNIEAYPNPFNSAVEIDFAIGPRQLDGESVSMSIHNIHGRMIVEIRHLPHIWQPGEDIPSGTYIVQLKVGRIEESKKISYIK